MKRVRFFSLYLSFMLAVSAVAAVSVRAEEPETEAGAESSVGVETPISLETPETALLPEPLVFPEEGYLPDWEAVPDEEVLPPELAFPEEYAETEPPSEEPGLASISDAPGPSEPDVLPDRSGEPGEPGTNEVVPDGLTSDDAAEGYVYAQEDSSSLRGASLPSSYSISTTPIRNQGSNSLCWDFTALAVMETWLQQHGYGSYDLSEMHMAYATSSYSSNSTYGVSRAPGGEGSRELAAIYLMRGNNLNSSGSELCIGGATYESYDRYSTSALPSRSLSTTLYGKPKMLMPKDILFLCGNKANGDGLSTQKIKELIQQYGAVGASINIDDAMQKGTSSYYNNSTGALFRNYKLSSLNHDVTIIGWDDNYSRTNFKSACRPSSNGAWKVKNSWGTSFGNAGYIWVSYEDPNFPSDAYAISSVIGYDSSRWHTHEYDYLQTTGYWNPYKDGTLFLRYFTLTQPEVLKSVRVFLPDAGSTAQVDVIPDYGHKDMSSYTFNSLGQVTNTYPGWYTIDLNTPQLLDPTGVSGSCSFAVVVKCNKRLGIDSSNESCSAFRHLDKSYAWQTGSNSAGWRIKAVNSTDTEFVHIHQALAYLMSGSNLWNMIKSSNTNIGAVKSNLKTAGSGPYGTTFTYSADESSVISANGTVTRPSSSAAVTTPVKLSVKVVSENGNYNFTLTLNLGVEHRHALTKVAAKAPTCTAAGNKEYYKCSGCSRLYLRNDECTGTTADQLKIAAKGHKWDKGKVTKMPTSTTEGSRIYTCTVCRATRTEKLARLASRPMYRLYMPSTHEHFYTADTYERQVLLTQRGWKDEGIGWYAPEKGDPVYRLFNPYTTDHHYTMDFNEYTILGRSGWQQEGIGWYSDTQHRVPLYRLFTPNLVVGAHHYTLDAYERGQLLATGAWRDEGIGWYGLP